MLEQDERIVVGARVVTGRLVPDSLILEEEGKRCVAVVHATGTTRLEQAKEEARLSVVRSAGHDDPPEGRAAQRKEAIGPGGTGHGRVPPLANRKIGSQRVERLKCSAGVIRHDLMPLGGGCARIHGGIVSNKTSVVVLILAQDIGGLMLGAR